MASGIIEKVTAFVTRQREGERQLLLFEHPDAGVQIPAGTIEIEESPERAVLREAAEETGLTEFSALRYLGCAERELPAGQRVMARSTTVYARPDATSFDWAHLRRGIPVVLTGRSADGFTQVTYEELDRVPDPQYVTMCITAWVPDDALAGSQRRHFFLLAFDGQTDERWTVFTDNHAFTLFWASLTDLPEIVHPQDEWLDFLYKTSFE
ncbi:MAG: NUDIX domain-containing protein [Anaerolineae bacterium]|nr:NUDIX domain-containing protein [Anaerolineae bacterium]